MSHPTDGIRDFGPYDGPLADRQVAGECPAYAADFGLMAEAPAMRAFAAWLGEHPIRVHVPGEKYLAFTMTASSWVEGLIQVSAANLLLAPLHQCVGPWQPDKGAMLEWAFAVFDHYGLVYVPHESRGYATPAELIAGYRRDSVPVDWHDVAAQMQRCQLPVPADLFDDHSEWRPGCGDPPSIWRPSDEVWPDWSEDDAEGWGDEADLGAGYGLVARQPDRPWSGAPLTIGPDAIDGLADALQQSDGPIVVGALDRWPLDALEVTRFVVSCEPLERPARLDGDVIDVDRLVTALVAALETPDSMARRVRPEGMIRAERAHVMSAMASGGVSRFYVDRMQPPLDEGLLYDIFEELIFDEDDLMGGEGGSGDEEWGP